MEAVGDILDDFFRQHSADCRQKTLHGPLAMGVKVDVLKFFRI